MTEPLIGLLSGPVGAGKTTVAERVAGLARRRGLRCGGLLAPALKNRCGHKVGIWGVEIGSVDRRILARTDRDLQGPLVGPYSFDAEALAWANGVLEDALASNDLLIVDEIGKLELWQAAGLAPILPRLAIGQANRALVVVRDSLLQDLQSRLVPVSDVVFRVREDNRQELPLKILDQLAGTMPSGSSAQLPEQPRVRG